MTVEPLRILVFDAQGGPMFALPYSSCEWSDSISEPGSLDVKVVYSDVALRVPAGLFAVMRVWGVILAAVRGRDVVHAGWLTGYQWDPKTATLDLQCGGGWSILSKRLVMNHRLDSSWRDGDVFIDQDHPAGDWLLELRGSYRDIASGLVREAMKWGALPFDLPPVDGGSAHDLPYAGYDLATTADRLSDLAGREDGDEIRMDPVLSDGGRLSWLLRSEPEIVDHMYTADGLGVLTAMAPGQQVMLTGVKGEGASMTGQVYAAGGKDQDRTLMCRAGEGIPGLPLLQSKDTEHTTVSDLDTLRRHARDDLAYGDRPDVTYGLDVGQETPLAPGDWVDVQVDDLFLGPRLLRLKVTDVSGSSGSDWTTVQARERVMS